MNRGHLVASSPLEAVADSQQSGWPRTPSCSRAPHHWFLSLDEHVLHVCKLRDLDFCRRIAAKLIGDDLRQYLARTQDTPEEALGDSLVAPLLQQDVEFDAMLIDCTPLSLDEQSPYRTGHTGIGSSRMSRSRHVKEGILFPKRLRRHNA
jgi:hypothetical protein